MVNGRWLRSRREHAGLTQRQLGTRLGLSSPYLSDLERNRRECPADIAAAYRRLR